MSKATHNCSHTCFVQFHSCWVQRQQLQLQWCSLAEECETASIAAVGRLIKLVTLMCKVMTLPQHGLAAAGAAAANATCLQELDAVCFARTASISK